MQSALEASKIMGFSRSTPQENDLSSKKKKKKEKTISLKEFISGNTQTDVTRSQLETNGNIDGCKTLIYLSGQTIPAPELVQDEKPQKTRRKKKSHEKSVEEEVSKRDLEHKEHKVMSATHEESIKAEMVHVQEELSKRDEIVIEQRKTVEKQKGWISDLQ
ncbi:hypothetical protein QZH41_015915, partial [Actinostola sp. cb2023]